MRYFSENFDILNAYTYGIQLIREKVLFFQIFPVKYLYSLIIYSPSLRFPEFSEEWVEKKLGEIGKFSKGKNISKNDIVENGKYKCIRYGELYTHYGEVISEIKSSTNCNENDLVFSEENDVIIPSSGESNIDIATASCVLKSGIALGGDLNIIKTSLNGVFLSYYLNNQKKNEIAKLAQGNSVVHLYSSQLSSLKIKFPTLKEQTKIANFLTKLDEKIFTQRELIEDWEVYKKGVMQKLFSQEIRFPNFSDEWEEKTLGEVLIEKNEKSKINNQHRVISSTAKGLFYQDEYFNREVASKENTGYKILKINQLVFSPQNLWLGNINVNTEFKIGIVSPSYKIFDFNENFTTPLFCKYFFKTSKMLFEYEQSSEQGASVVRRNLNMDLFLNICISLPTLEEQNQIANFLSKIDEKIEAEQQILEYYQQQKAYFLQNMFV